MMKLTSLWILLILICSSVKGQAYNLDSFPSYDPQVKTGVLSNGMKYYIRANKLPEKLAEFYLAVNAGAIQENDDQNGLAHFTEHMAFNGTRNFPKKSLIDYLGTLGVKFGRNLNAGTGVEQTTYRVTSVPLTREGIMDSVMLVLQNWAAFVSFDDAEIESERGVIREEWRMYGSANERMNIKLAPIIYKDSKYANRNVIGDTAVINNFKPETLRNFYKNWYRPDLQALIFVGDFDVNVVEAKIKRFFSEIPPAVNPVPKEIYPIPDNVEPLIGIATDPETTTTEVSVIYKADAVKDSDRNIGFMRLKLLQRMINVMFVQRMAEITRKENPPFLYAYCRYASFTRVKDAFNSFAQARNNESLRALVALLTEMERLKQFGFTTSEHERVKASLLRSYESQYAEKDKRKSSELVNLNISNFMINYPNPGIEFEYNFAKTMLSEITLEEINTEVKKYVHPENMIVTVTAPEKEGISVPTEQEIKHVIDSIKYTKIEAYVDSFSGKKLIEKEPVPGKVIKETSNPAMGTTEWKLSNGVRVIFKPTTFKEDEILLDAWSDGGFSTVPDNDIPSAQVTDNVAVEMGVGNFSRTDLGKVLAGKRASISPSLSHEREAFYGSMSPKDFETALQIIYLYFTHPRWSEPEYETWMDRMRSNFINIRSEPRKAYSDSVNVILSNRSKRYRPTTYETFDEVSYDKIKAFYHNRFSDASDFTFIFTGKINPDEIRSLVEKYLASLPVVKRKDDYKDDGVRPPQGKVVNDFSHENKTPRTSVFVNYHGKCRYTAQDMLYLAVIRHILELRYTEAIREEKGGSYRIAVSANIGRLPEPQFSLSMTFDTDPKLADLLKDIVHKEINKLISDGPSDADLQKVREFFLKQRHEDLKENSWWYSRALPEYYYNHVDVVNGYEQRVRDLKTKSIKEYAQKLLTQGNTIEVIMRPKGG